MTDHKKFISEDLIEKVMTEMEGEASKLEQHLKHFEEEQGAIYNWLISESFDILIQEEKDHMFYLALVIWRATSNNDEPYHLISPEEIEKADETTWSIFLEAKGKFKSKLDVFFENYDQEDLLAFVEDALEIEEDDFLTPVGREIIFVSMKTLIDLLK